MMMIIWIVTVVYGSLDICLSKDINEIKKYDYSQTCLRERPFNLKWGGYGFFLKKYSDSQCCWKNILILVEEKKKSDSEFLSYNLMINSGNKIRALHNKKNKYSNSCVVRKTNFWTKKKTKAPPPPPASQMVGPLCDLSREDWNMVT